MEDSKMSAEMRDAIIAEESKLWDAQSETPKELIDAQFEAMGEKPTVAQVTEALIEQTSTDARSGYWQVPNSYFKRIRKLSMNEVRAECMRLAAAVVDQRNANAIIMQENEKLREERVAMNKAMEGSND